MSRFKYLSLLPLLFLASCFEFDIDAPPRNPAATITPPEQISIVQVPASIDLADIQTLLTSELSKKPLAQGETGKMSAKLLVNERTIIEEPRQIVEVPYRAAECSIKKVPRQIKRRIKTGTRMVSCALRPWKWGRCAQDVFKEVVRTVYDDVRECIPEQLEIVKTVITPVVKIKEALFPSKINIRYRANLKNLDLAGGGDALDIKMLIGTEIWVDISQGALGENITVKGALKCKADVETQTKAKLVFEQAGADVQISPSVEDIALDIKKLCLPGAVEALDIASYSNPMNILIRKALGQAIDKQLKKAINKSISKKRDDLTLTALAGELVASLNEPVRLADKIWMSANSEKVFVTPIDIRDVTGSLKLTTGLGLRSKPVVLYGDRPDAQPLPAPAFELGSNTGQFQISPKGVIPFSQITEILQSEAERLLAKHAPNLRVGSIAIDTYQSGDKLVFGLEAKDVGFFKRDGTFYMMAVPKLDGDKRQIRLTNLSFDLSTNSFLIDNAAWIFENKILEELEKKMRFNFNDDLEKAVSKLAKFEEKTAAGTLSGELNDVTLNSIGVEGQNLAFIVTATGSVRFEGDL